MLLLITKFTSQHQQCDKITATSQISLQLRLKERNIVLRLVITNRKRHPLNQLSKFPIMEERWYVPKLILAKASISCR
jgi:hypothetical protein